MRSFVGYVLFILTFFTLGCASLRWDQYKQYIRVTSKPEGAEIYDNYTLLGRTPAIVPIRRGIHPKIELYYPGSYRQKVSLKTKYRWVESMGAAGILLTAAPMAWLIDLSTGNAWDIQDADNVLLPGANLKLDQTSESQLIAVAPPQANDREVSERVGEALQESLKASPKSSGQPRQWLNFKDTLGKFYDYQYTYEFRPPKDKELGLFGPLGITHVLESEVSKDGIAHYQIRDIRTLEITQQGEMKLSTEILNPRTYTFKEAFKNWILDSIPNTATIDSSGESTTVDLTSREPLYGKDKPMNSIWGEATRFLGTVSFTNLLPPHQKKSFDWHFRLTPLLSFAYHRINFDSDAAFFRETDFKVFRTSAGVGPQIALESIFGVFYFSVVPGFALASLEYDSPVASGSTTKTFLNIGTEFGYYRFFSDRWAVKLSVKSLQEDLELWNKSMDKSQGIDIPVERVSQTIYAISACYYFPDLKRQLRR